MSRDQNAGRSQNIKTDNTGLRWFCVSVRSGWSIPKSTCWIRK